MSLPMRERELKHRTSFSRVFDFDVAPHAGARIETTKTPPFQDSGMSLPMRERELKPRANVENY